MEEKESHVKTAEENESGFPVAFQTTKTVPLVNEQGKMLLPPAKVGEGCPTPFYANPRQILRILKRRETKRRLVSSGRLRKRINNKRKDSRNAANTEPVDPQTTTDYTELRDIKKLN